jgi:hypothetical protein
VFLCTWCSFISSCEFAFFQVDFWFYIVAVPMVNSRQLLKLEEVGSQKLCAAEILVLILLEDHCINVFRLLS